MNADHYKILLDWLIHNYPSYEGLKEAETSPQPTLLSDFDNNKNNTDTSEDTNVDNIIDGKEMSYAPGHELSESTGSFNSEKEFILLYPE